MSLSRNINSNSLKILANKKVFIMSKMNRKLQDELDYISYIDLSTQKYNEVVYKYDGRNKKLRCIKVADCMCKMVWD